MRTFEKVLLTIGIVTLLVSPLFHSLIVITAASLGILILALLWCD